MPNRWKKFLQSFSTICSKDSYLKLTKKMKQELLVKDFKNFTKNDIKDFNYINK
jgi:hypothetical protein